jgi:hypothetical protein
VWCTAGGRRVCDHRWACGEHAPLLQMGALPPHCSSSHPCCVLHAPEAVSRCGGAAATGPVWVAVNKWRGLAAYWVHAFCGSRRLTSAVCAACCQHLGPVLDSHANVCSESCCRHACCCVVALRSSCCGRCWVSGLQLQKQSLVTGQAGVLTCSKPATTDTAAWTQHGQLPEVGTSR